MKVLFQTRKWRWVHCNCTFNFAVFWRLIKLLYILIPQFYSKTLKLAHAAPKRYCFLLKNLNMLFIQSFEPFIILSYYIHVYHARHFVANVVPLKPCNISNIFSYQISIRLSHILVHRKRIKFLTYNYQTMPLLLVKFVSENTCI